MDNDNAYLGAIQEHKEWRGKAFVLCKDLTDDSEFDRFIPESSVKNFFSDATLKQLLSRHIPRERRDAACRDIRKGYLRVYCILLDIHKPHLIEHFTHHPELQDARLPFRLQPTDFPQDEPLLWSEFYQAQRIFCPATLTDQQWTLYCEEQVLPIVSKKRLQGGATADLFCAHIHSEYDKLDGKKRARYLRDHRRVALKIYKDSPSLAKNYAEREAQNFGMIKNSGNYNERPGLIEFYCAYHHKGQSHAVLEYADQDTLETFFWNVQPPSTGTQIIAFWASILQVMKGLVSVHNVDFDPDDTAGFNVFQGWHQDVKPSNILVFSDEGQFKHAFKLADLGISHFHAATHVGERCKADDQQGTSTYGAPEVWRSTRFSSRSRLPVTNKIDIFSLGCVLLEAAVWVVHGKTGLGNFRHLRARENEKGNNPDAGDCFHDGKKVLEVVKEQQQSLEQDLRVSDHITSSVLDIIAGMIKTNPRERYEALPLLSTLEGKISKAQDKILGRRFENLSGYSGRAQHRTKSMGDPPSTRTTHSERQARSVYWDTESDKSDAVSSVSTFTPEPLQQEPLEMTSIVQDDPAKSPPRCNSNMGRRANGSVLSEGGHPLTPLDTRQPANVIEPTPQTPKPDSPHYPPDTSGTDLGSQPVDTPKNSSPYTPKSSFDHGYHSINGPSEEPAEPHNDLIQSPPNSPLPATPSPGRSIPASPALPPAVTSPFANTFKVTLDEIFKWRNECRGRSTKLWRSAPPMPGEHLKPRLKNRDHVLIVDNASSMSDHWDDLIGILDPIFYVLKDCDPDGVEFYWANGGDPQPLRFPSTKEMLLEAEKKERQFKQEQTDIGVRLDAILADYCLKLASNNRHHRPRPMNIYIFTDGIWAAGGDAATPIKRMVRELKKHGLHRNQVGIQFISFGDNEDALQRLAQLDLLGKDREVGMDIVDTEPHHGDFWKMLLGAINTRFDADTQQQAA